MVEGTRQAFQTSLTNTNEFTITYELVPGRGSGGKRLEKILRFAEQATADGRIKALSITDNPGGHPALSPTSLGLEIQAMGMDVLLHFSLKDKNRNLVESQLFACHRHNLVNLLVLGGDFPRYGFKGRAMPVFDLDSPQVLDLINRLRQGMSIEKGAPGGKIPLPPMDFFAGCVVSPFKKLESEQVWQYVKLLSKINSGAQFVISQLGFDIKKYRELMQFIDAKNLSIPAIANVFVPNLAVARAMNRGLVPGVILPDSLLFQMEKEAKTASRGEESRLLRAAKTIMLLQEMGYAGVHIGGNNLDFNAVSFILDSVEQVKKDTIAEETHFPEPNTWYLYDKSSAKQTKRKTSLSYSVNHWIHKQFFSRQGAFFPISKQASLFCAKGVLLAKIYLFVEHLSKKLLFRCRMCGDCTLAEANYLCPQSGCPKRMINGPCGGSIDGFCEVYPKQRLCFWVRSYKRGRTPDRKILPQASILPPKDWSLVRTSSWINYFSGKDHCKLTNKK